MKNLKIEVLENKRKKIEGYSCYQGLITVGNFKESFYLRLNNWSLQDYKNQWKEGLERIKTHNSSCLIADIFFDQEDIYMQIYYLYKVGNKIFVQYQMYSPEIFKFLKTETLPFDPFNYENRYKNIPQFESHDEEGNKIETWEVDL